ncbi:MAG: N-acetylmuramoyl-L-alanine amidase [Patescibacteria group bacterium]
MSNRHKKTYAGVVAGALLLLGAAGLYLDSQQPATDIKQNIIGRNSLSEGRVTSGRDTAPGDAIATDTELAYESPELETGLPKTNAIGISWVQQGGGDAHIEVRTHDGGGWSEWLEIESSGDRPDFAEPTGHGAILLTADAKRAQYRFALHGEGGGVKVSDAEVTAIDATTGPDPTKKTLLGRLFGSQASAISNPRIYSRSEWGSPEPNGSPRWTPRYHKLSRVMVHHTVSNATSSFSGSAANVRAIWDYHANSLGWGDIGYNYLVDQSGHIFQGRYYNKSFAEANTVEVEGGHTYSFNDRSIGIAALGNFQNVGPKSALLENIGKIAGFKIAPYGLGATAAYLDEGVSSAASSGCPPARGRRSQYRIAGHRNYCSTACPGDHLYARLGTIRNRAQVYSDLYSVQRYWDYSFVEKSQHNVSFHTGETTDIYIDLKNEGENTWQNTGSPVVRLGTDRLRDRSSRFSATWIAPNRAATFENQSGGGGDGDIHTVQPGETARFSFTATAPALTGAYKEYFRPVAEGVAWFPRDIGINWALTVLPPGYNYEFVSKSATPSEITAGVNEQDVTVRLKNTGTEPWPIGGDLRLGTDRTRDHLSAFATLDGADPWIAPNRPSAVDSNVTDPGNVATVEPGETAAFDFTITIPDDQPAGSYRLYVRPVMESVTWLPEDYGTYFPIPVAKARDHSFAKTVYEHSQFSLSQGGTMYARVAVTNTGRLSWPVGGTNPVRFGTSRPRDRTSAFRTMSGIDPWPFVNRASDIDGRVESLAGDLGPDDVTESVTEITPGETALFTVYLTANVPPGTYREFFTPVQEGMAWFPEYGYNMLLGVVE